MRYQKDSDLGEGVICGITVVAFSPDGLHLAAGGKDRKLCVWRISDGTLLHVFTTASPIFSLLWIPDCEGVIVCGMEDGTLSNVVTGKSRIQGRNFPRNHNFVVERLAAKGNCLASGALEELALWKRGRNGTSARQWEHEFDLGLPPSNSENQDDEVIITSIHWTRSPSHGSVLIVTYMHHGYMIYNTYNWKLLYHNSLNGLIGDASMTLDGTRLVVSNMRSGFDIYDAATGRAVGTLKHPVNQVRAIPVRFVHGGNAILGGSTVGAAHLWDVTELRMHPPLVVQGVSVCCAVLWTHTYALLLS
ncbi:WD40 repeat-like protein [Polyporus arcularius HHB13444]|uniref:WD40 repeat-like protein n=1 Tax=Polyporus arcularius HHB13444 TaxID=1314778 RepID=A0A5C3PL46_9APHY|nr:WD40 repeat-like protein [Polyporus arcularius HHB13444]